MSETISLLRYIFRRFWAVLDCAWSVMYKNSQVLHQKAGDFTPTAAIWALRFLLFPFPQVLHLLPLILSVCTLHQSSIKRLASPTHVCSSEKHCVSDRPFMTLLDSDYRTYPPLPPPHLLYEALWDSGTSLNSSTVCFIQSTWGQTPYLSKKRMSRLNINPVCIVTLCNLVHSHIQADWLYC